MPKFTLSQMELVNVLDDKYPNSYDELWGVLQGKILDVLSEKKWIEIWEEGNYKMELSITFNEIKELQNA